MLANSALGQLYRQMNRQMNRQIYEFRRHWTIQQAMGYPTSLRHAVCSVTDRPLSKTRSPARCAGTPAIGTVPAKAHSHHGGCGPKIASPQADWRCMTHRGSTLRACRSRRRGSAAGDPELLAPTSAEAYGPARPPGGGTAIEAERAALAVDNPTSKQAKRETVANLRRCGEPIRCVLTVMRSL